MRAAALVLAVLAALAPAARADVVDAALARARRSGKPVLLEFRADWCGPCVHFEREILSDDDVQEALAGVELVRVDVDDDASTAAQRRYQVGVIPTFIALDADGRMLDRIEGIADFVEDGAFAGFLERLVARGSTGRPNAQRLALERAAEREVVIAFADIGTRDGIHALARAVLSGALAPAVQDDLFARHVAAARDSRTAALATYVAIAGGDNSGAMTAARRAVELGPDDDVAHAALAHARRSAGLRYGTMEFASACSREAEGTPERARCEGELERLMTGRTPPAARWLRQAADLFVRHAITPGPTDEDERRRLDALVDLAVVAPERAIARDRQVRLDRRERRDEAPLATVVQSFTAVGSVRLDGGDASRALAGVHVVLPWRPREVQVQPTALVRAEAGADGDGRAAYDAEALVGVSVAGVIGLYGGIGVNDPGAGARASMSVPFELALSSRGRRTGAEAFVRTSWTSWSRAEREGGAEHAVDGTDELSLGAAIRVPGPLGRAFLVGVRYDEILHGHLVGFWIGSDIFAR
ncbi:MAG TPA: thioredoxin family protein [Kofleriaceae bacterium]|nr:thioredoxin family protein [Kofleriaceae bacterium]